MSYGIFLKVWGDYALFTRPEMKVERVSYEVMTPSAARGILEAIYWKPGFRWVVDEIRVLNPIRFTNLRRNEISTKIPIHGATGVLAAMEDPSRHPSVDVTEQRQQRASLLLRDVCYIIRAHVHLCGEASGMGLETGPEPEPERAMERMGTIAAGAAGATATLTAPVIPSTIAAVGKHLDIFKRRARRGQTFHHPYFGCREFPVFFELIESSDDLPEPHEALRGVRELGFLLHDLEFDQEPATKRVRSVTPHFFPAVLRDGVLSVPPLPFVP